MYHTVRYLGDVNAVELLCKYRAVVIDVVECQLSRVVGLQRQKNHVK